MKQKQMKGVCLLIAGILFLLLFFSFSGIEKTKLLDTDGRNFEKAEVTNVISGNLSNSGSGKQTVELKLLSGDHKGKIIQATSSQSYLFGAKCKKGMKVIAIINESKGELLASVYSVNRGPMVWLMAAVFVAIVVAVGGRKGISSILSLVFTMLCIFFIFLPMIYKGISPILAAVLVVAFTTVVTMCMVDGITKKSVAAMLGTIIGVVFSGAFALIFGQVTSITGYNVSDIENLVYVGEMTDIKIGELLLDKYIINYPNIRKNKRLFDKILNISENIPYPGELKNIIKTAVAFSDTTSPDDYLKRLFYSIVEVKDKKIKLEDLKNYGFTLREIETLTGVPKSSVANKLKEDGNE